jgi:thiol-disulfide isomerase/thioredoxin
MKKFLSVALLVLLCCAPLCACSTDFSEPINETMDGLYQTLYDALELFFKKTGVENGDENNENGGNSGNEGGSNEDSKPDDIVPEPLPEEKYEIGTSVGKKLPSYSVEIFDENGVSGEYIDPSDLGKVTVINFWGTWCPYCVDELPEFSKVATEYKDTVTIVAIHSVKDFTSNAVSHIKNNFSDSDIIFARDINTGEDISYDECYEALGGNGYYPYTIILNEKGVITYAKEGALSEFQLKTQLEIALGN